LVDFLFHPIERAYKKITCNILISLTHIFLTAYNRDLLDYPNEIFYLKKQQVVRDAVHVRKKRKKGKKKEQLIFLL